MSRYTTDERNYGYQCDQCGKQSLAWKAGWKWFGSISMVESRPDLIPHLCSDECAAAFQRRMDAGEVSVPDVKPHGYNNYTVKGEHKGY